MAEITFRVDPAARNPAGVQSLIDSLYARPNVQDLLSSSRDRSVLVTDNLNSLSDANRRQIESYDPGRELRGFTQQVGPNIIYSNPGLEPTDRLKGFVHEIGHIQGWPGGTGTLHTPQFYDRLGTELNKLGLPVDPARDLNRPGSQGDGTRSRDGNPDLAPGIEHDQKIGQNVDDEEADWGRQMQEEHDRNIGENVDTEEADWGRQLQDIEHDRNIGQNVDTEEADWGRQLQDIEHDRNIGQNVDTEEADWG